jgi:transcriptional regulator with XRE-family HTH domain
MDETPIVGGARAPGRQSIRHQLAHLMESEGLTAYEVGRLSGVDAGQIRRFLNGQRPMQVGTLETVAAALGIRVRLNIEGARPRRGKMSDEKKGARPQRRTAAPGPRARRPKRAEAGPG